LTPGTSVFEVGCGAGAFLYELEALGCKVGGVDHSPALIGKAMKAMPSGGFKVSDAAAFQVEPRAGPALTARRPVLAGGAPVPANPSSASISPRDHEW
jgi:ubiquinone/menaquinone biosynthesis C-methylase UbiE